MSLPTKTDVIPPRVVHTFTLRTGTYRIVKRGGNSVDTYDIEMRFNNSLGEHNWRDIGCFRYDDARCAADTHDFLDTVLAHVLKRHTDTPVLTTLELDSLVNRLVVACGHRSDEWLPTVFRELLLQAFRSAYPMRSEA